MFLIGGAALRKRFPRVSYRTEAPFIVGGAITFGLITYLHHSVYSKAADPFFAVKKKEEPAGSDNFEFNEADWEEAK